MESLKEIEYLYNNMTTCETIRLKPHLEVIENELLANTKKIKLFEIIKEHFVNIGGTRGNFEGKKPKNEIVITLKDLTEEEFDLLEEKLR